MQKSLWPNLLKGSFGFLIGIGLWWGLSTPYARLLAALSEPLIHLTERPNVTRLIPAGTEMTIDRTDFPRASPRPALRLMDLTFNIILLTTLFAADRQTLSNRNVAGFLLAGLVLVLVHVAAVFVNIQSIYALRLGAWSQRNYGAVARNVWSAAAHFYTLVGALGSPLALWWLFRPAALPPPKERSPRRRKQGR